MVLYAYSPHASALSKRHFDRFGRFCRVDQCVSVPNGSRENKTLRPRATYVAIGRVSAIHAMWLGLQLEV